jgi:hypothetical protein
MPLGDDEGVRRLHSLSSANQEIGVIGDLSFRARVSHAKR